MIDFILKMAVVTMPIIGFMVVMHYLAYAISWGYWKGRIKVNVKDTHDFNINVNK